MTPAGRNSPGRSCERVPTEGGLLEKRTREASARIIKKEPGGPIWSRVQKTKGVKKESFSGKEKRKKKGRTALNLWNTKSSPKCKRLRNHKVRGKGGKSIVSNQARLTSVRKNLGKRM